MFVHEGPVSPVKDEVSELPVLEELSPLHFPSTHFIPLHISASIDFIELGTSGFCVQVATHVSDFEQDGFDDDGEVEDDDEVEDVVEPSEEVEEVVEVPKYLFNDPSFDNGPVVGND